MLEHTRRKVLYLVAAAVLTLAGSLVSQARADFILTGTEYLNVTAAHDTGILYDSSTAKVLGGGYIQDAYISGSASLLVQRPSGEAVGTARVYDAGLVAVSSGNLSKLYAYGNSGVDMTGGYISKAYVNDEAHLAVSAGGKITSIYASNASSVAVNGATVDFVRTNDTSSAVVSSATGEGPVSGGLDANDNSTMTVIGGSFYSLRASNTSNATVNGGNFSGWIEAFGSSMVTLSGGETASLFAYYSGNVAMSGGSVALLRAGSTSHVDVRGGTVSTLSAYEGGTVVLHGTDFQGIVGLTLDGNEVIGTGLLTGKWFDGTSWAITIDRNDSTATILAIPEPATLGLLLFGGLALLRRRGRA